MNRRIVISTASLLTVLATAPVFAKTNEVNTTGATLFRGFFESSTQGSDAIDLDGDGSTTDLGAAPPTFDSIFGLYNVQSRGIGSGNGFEELVELGNINGAGFAWSSGNYNSNDYATRNGVNATPSSSFTGDVLFDISAVDVPSSFFVTDTRAGAAWDNSPFAPGNAPRAGYGNASIRSYANVTGGSLSVGNQSNKLKSLTPDYDNGTSGVQGTNPNTLQAGTTLNLNQGNPDRNTLFDTQIAWTPIASFANYGAQVDSNEGAAGGEGEIRKTTLQHLAVTGRTELGENLVMVTRDSGSGTRNGYANSIGVDPSQAIGENTGKKSGSGASDFDRLGADFLPSNKGGSSRMEGTTTNHRLAVGYSGLADGASSNSRAGDDAVGGRYQLLAVANDTDVTDTDGTPAWDGVSYVFPKFGNSSADASSNNVIYNADPNSGWQIGGSQTFVTEGDPLAGSIIGTNVVAGQVTELRFATAVEEAAIQAGTYTPASGDLLISEGSGNFADGVNNGQDVKMFNPYAAAYMRNIITSLGDAEVALVTNPDYTGDPGQNNDPDNDPEFIPDPTGTPGDFLAASFALVPAVGALPDTTNTDIFTPNSQLSADLRTTLANDPSQLPTDAITTGYGPTASNGNRYGRYSDRTAGTYLDGSGSDDYITNDGTTVSDGSDMDFGNAIADRNAIAGDFDDNGVRDVNDIDDMVIAYLNSAASGTTRVDKTGRTLQGRQLLADGTVDSDGDAILEILADFNGDGNFDIEDVRYGADGLFNRGRTVGTEDDGDATVDNKLDRKANFTEVDEALAQQLDLADDATDNDSVTTANLFGTTLSTGTYDNGDSRGDVAGTSALAGDGVTTLTAAAGWAPIGYDGTVDIEDVEYVYSQFAGKFGDNSVDWSVLDEVAAQEGLDRADLSADMNGDLVIDALDLAEIVEGILDSALGDLDLDGDVDIVDFGTFAANFGTSVSDYGLGDLDGDGDNDIVDFGTFAAGFGFGVDLTTEELALFESFSASVTSTIPEPTSLALLSLGGLAALRRRRA